MISLKTQTEPYDIELPYGVTVTVKPLTTAGMAAPRRESGGAGPGTPGKRSAAGRVARPRGRGGTGRLVPGPAHQGARYPAYHGLVGSRGRSTGHAGERRRRHGPLSRWRAVFSGVHAEAGAPERGKKRIRALCRWHFGGGPDYCEGCRREGAACAKGGIGLDGHLCPYREHALRTLEEHQAWDVLLACLGQLRLAPSGHVIGIDLGVAMKIAEARGCDPVVVSELLQAAETGLVEAMNTPGEGG